MKWVKTKKKKPKIFKLVAVLMDDGSIKKAYWSGMLWYDVANIKSPIYWIDLPKIKKR